MALTAGIVGLPNVGKSTLFNAITKAKVLAANYPFATIDPNVGVVEVPDYRLDELTRLVQPKKTVPTTFEFTDIAGLVKGASKGEGLGNQFLSNIRNVDAIVEVVRCFDDSNIVHVDGSISPVRDVETINLELIFSDLDIIEKRIPKIQKKAQVKDGDAPIEYALLMRLQETLENEKPIRSLNLTADEQKMISSFCFLTAKPILYVANVAVDDLLDISANKYYKELKEYASKENAKVIYVCAQIEAELVDLEGEEKQEFLADLGIDESGLDRLIKESYNLLGLATYFTAGPQEVRAWTFKKGMLAPDCAGIIHTDFKKGFIKAETISYEDLIECGGMAKAKELGKVRIEGKEYVVQDGDVMLFRFNV